MSSVFSIGLLIGFAYPWPFEIHPIEGNVKLIAIGNEQ